MSDPSPTPTLPAWVKKRDGRVVPFDPDAIIQDLFAAAESVGRSDPFLARELTDGVLHFLAADCPESIPGTSWIGDLVIKVVRELRQPWLAQALLERSQLSKSLANPSSPLVTPTDVVRRSLEAYSLNTIFSRELAAAHREGLVGLTGLNAPRELAAALITPPEVSGTLQALQLLESVLEARGGVADWVAIDGADYLELEPEALSLPRLLTPVLQAAGLTARLHLNAADPPAWAAYFAHGPLFSNQGIASPVEPLAAAAAIVHAVFDIERERCPFAIDWHLADRDFAAPENSCRGDLLASMVRAALGEYPITFVFDRPRRPLSLGPGLDRLHSYLLMEVNLDLPHLLKHTGITDDTELYLRKMGSLARLAVSAAVQKRHYLRESLHEKTADRSFLQRGFLLDRARLVVTLLGMEECVSILAGAGLYDGKAGLELARRILQSLHEVLAEEGKRRLVDCVVDVRVNPTGWTVSVPLRQQLAVAGRLHAAKSAGTAIALLADHERLSVDQVIGMLDFAWRQTEICRLAFHPRPLAELQPTLLV